MRAIVGAVFDGERSLPAHAVVIDGERIAAVVPAAALDAAIPREDAGGLIVPGFIDVQVNGGGDVLFNDAPTIDGIRAIAAAHRPYGTTALLATVITDRPPVMLAAIDAVAEALAAGVPGCLGIHCEGPFIALTRKGAHDPDHIRVMTDEDCARLAATTVRPFLLTLAPESVDDQQVARLAAAGIAVSLGHSDAGFDEAASAFAAGARSGTHIFNAMSQLGSREPGLAGAILAHGDVWCGVIADGHHIHPATIAAAVRAKAGPARLLAITDAMPTVGGGDVFHLGGRKVTRRAGRLTLDDGTLAGSDLTMIGAVKYLAGPVGLPIEEALRMASLYPAQFLGIDGERGRIAAGCRADLVVLDDALDVIAVLIGGSAG